MTTTDSRHPRTKKGRERIYFEHFWNDFSADKTRSVKEADRKLYAAAYAQPGGMCAGFSYFSDFERDAADFGPMSQTKLTTPVLTIAGEKSAGAFLGTQAQIYATSVQSLIVKDSGHWLIDEAPDPVVPALVNLSTNKLTRWVNENPVHGTCVAPVPRSTFPDRGVFRNQLRRIDMDLQLNGKIALVSGSTAGIGYAIARTLAQEGASVIVNGRTQAGVDEAVDRIRSETSGTVLGYAADLSQPEAANEVVRRHTGINILVNNLGIFEPKAFEDIPDEDWQRFFDVNVLSGVRLARLVLPEMKRANWGRIIFISSESAVQIPTEMIHYGMTKTAQLAVSRGLAESVAGTGITVNSVLPGPTKSRGVGDFVEGMARSSDKSFEQIEAEFFDHVRPTSLIKRFGTPQEVASLVAYVASPLASATTGAALRVDGGVIKSAF